MRGTGRISGRRGGNPTSCSITTCSRPPTGCAGEKRYFGVYDKSRGGGVYCEASRIGDDLGLGGVPWMSGVDGDRFFGRATDPETMASEVVWL